MMRVILRWLRLFTSYCLFGLLCFCACNFRTSIYLFFQAKGQLSVLMHRVPLQEYQQREDIGDEERSNILLVEQIKSYSVDSLGYLPTDNFTQVYDQKYSPALWVITACEPFQLRAYYWRFPFVGEVSYKGFFRKDLAEKEFAHFRSMGYDVDLRAVSAWSTLGWFRDPLMSAMLKGNKSALCNLLFHELFHATYYAPNNVEFNENIACFIADKATRLFLKGDTAELREYDTRERSDKLIQGFMLRKSNALRRFYSEHENDPQLPVKKIKFMLQIADSVKKLPVPAFLADFHARSVLEQKNAYFVDFYQYDSMQDSLESVFNKFYKGDLKKLVWDLKQNQTIITFDN